MKSPHIIAHPFVATPSDVGLAVQRTAMHASPIAGAAVLRAGVRGALLAHQGLQLLGKKDTGKPEDVQGPDYVVQFLKFLKYKEEHIARIKYYTEAIAKLAAIANWVVAAVVTVREVLRLMGVLDPDDEAERLQKEIAQKVGAIYNYLRDTDREEQFDRADAWRSKTLQVRNDLANLALSRSQDNMTDLKNARHDLMVEAINPMLALSAATIRFQNATYGGRPTPVHYLNEMPEHWTAYAFPTWMTTTGGESVNYGSVMDLEASIFDPGYYLDVLIDAIGVRIAALAATEPAFKSTGFDRHNLHTIYGGLRELVAAWEKSFIKTNIVGPIDPYDNGLGRHRIYHPWIGTGPEPMSALPLGVIDPVSGVSVFDPLWRQGLDLNFGLDGRWYVNNYAEAVSAAYTLQSLMMATVLEKCGLQSLRDLRDAVWALTSPPSGSSEILSLPDAKFRVEDITGTTTAGVTASQAPQEVDLGIVGHFAGKPGKKYPATLMFQPVVKRLRIPIARRMDGSKIQLGYRLRFSIGHASTSQSPNLPLDVSLTLAEYSAPAFPEQVLPLFPTLAQSRELTADNARVYDVLQSAIFSAAEEDAYEATGTVANKPRLFLNPRPGQVRARVDVKFEFNPADPTHPFIGFADVSIGTLGSTVAHPGFILFVEAFETRVSVLPNDEDVVREDPVDAMSLHFAPSFLVVEQEYFTDREAGLANMEKAVDSIDDKYRQSKLRLGPRIPVELVQRVAEEEELVRAAFAERAQQSPVLARQLAEQFAVPVVRR